MAMKLNRKKNIQRHLERQIYKTERKLEKLAEQAYHMRKQLTTLLEIKAAEQKVSPAVE